MKTLAVGVKCDFKPLGFGLAAFASKGDCRIIIPKVLDDEIQKFLGMQEILGRDVIGQRFVFGRLKKFIGISPVVVMSVLGKTIQRNRLVMFAPVFFRPQLAVETVAGEVGAEG